MRVVETIVVEVSTIDRHGIFRYFDRADPNAPELRRQPRSVDVQQDGAPVPVEFLTEGQGRYYVAKIGDPDRTLALGPHTYRIEYVIDDVLIDDPDSDGSRFYWQLIPGGWAQDIQQARLSVVLPADTADVRCAVGATATSGCSASGEGTTSLTVALADLDAFTPVTVQTDVAQPVPPTVGETYPWPPQYDRVLHSWPVVVLLVLAGLVAAAVGARASRRAHEPKPGFPLHLRAAGRDRPGAGGVHPRGTGGTAAVRRDRAPCRRATGGRHRARRPRLDAARDGGEVLAGPRSGHGRSLEPGRPTASAASPPAPATSRPARSCRHSSRRSSPRRSSGRCARS